MNNSPSTELDYPTIMLRVIRRHLEETGCKHSILEIAAEVDCEATKTINCEANRNVGEVSN
ncbi:MAG: hypothetical protein WCA39_12185 [Nitrososphaeraceae archaeon]